MSSVYCTLIPYSSAGIPKAAHSPHDTENHNPARESRERIRPFEVYLITSYSHLPERHCNSMIWRRLQVMHYDAYYDLESDLRLTEMVASYQRSVTRCVLVIAESKQLKFNNLFSQAPSSMWIFYILLTKIHWSIFVNLAFPNENFFYKLGLLHQVTSFRLN